MTNEYVDAVEALIDLETIRNANLKVIVDPMYGVGQLTLGNDPDRGTLQSNVHP